MIKIAKSDGDVVTWKDEDYTGYRYDSKFFIVVRGDQDIGFYNMNHVVSISINMLEAGGAASSESEPRRRCVEFNAVLTQEEMDSIFKALADKRCVDDG